MFRTFYLVCLVFRLEGRGVDAYSQPLIKPCIYVTGRTEFTV